MNEETIEITKTQYAMLCKDSWLLECLRNAGVDSWEGWDFAMEEFHATGEDD